MSRSCIAVMPVYNEAGGLEGVVGEWVRQMAAIDGMLLVVDDGSTDGTPAILGRMEAKAAGRLRVMRQANAGHGAAIRNGYREALALGSEWVFQVDSDGEMPASLFPEMWERRDTAAFLLGRREGRLVSAVRIALSTLHRWLLRWMFGVGLADPNTPFRLMRAAELRRLLAAVPEGVFAPNVFLALLAAKAGLLKEGPSVPAAPRAGGVPSIGGWRLARLALRCTGELWRFRRREWSSFAGR